MRFSSGSKKSSGRTLIGVGKPTSGLFLAQRFFRFANASERISLGSRVTLMLSMEFLEGQLQLRELTHRAPPRLARLTFSAKVNRKEAFDYGSLEAVSGGR
jgi:hypothetical protein